MAWNSGCLTMFVPSAHRRGLPPANLCLSIPVWTLLGKSGPGLAQRRKGPGRIEYGIDQPCPTPPRTLMVKSGQGLTQRRKAAKVRTGDGVSQQSPPGRGLPATTPDLGQASRLRSQGPYRFPNRVLVREGDGGITHMCRLFWLEMQCRGLPPANPDRIPIPLVSS